jgi:hypothetical protein
VRGSEIVKEKRHFKSYEFQDILLQARGQTPYFEPTATLKSSSSSSTIKRAKSKYGCMMAMTQQQHLGTIHLLGLLFRQTQEEIASSRGSRDHQHSPSRWWEKDFERSSDGGSRRPHCVPLLLNQKIKKWKVCVAIFFQTVNDIVTSTWQSFGIIFLPWKFL